MKKIYEITIEEKVIVWKRTSLDVGANSEREALEKSLNYINNQRENDIVLINEEYVFETEERMDPKDNNGSATLEVFNDFPFTEDNSIYNNEIKDSVW